MSEKTKATLQMMLCAILWSLGGLCIKSIPWNAFAIAGARSLIAAAVIFIYMKIARVPMLVNRHTLAVMIGLTGTFFSFVTATKLTTAANAIVIQYTGPLFLLLYCAIFRKQKFRPADYFVVLLTLLGIAVFFLDGLGAGTIAGNLVALLSGVFFAAMFVTTGDATDEERINGLLQGQLLTAVIGLPFFLIFPVQITWSAVGYILILGVFQLGLAYVLYSRAMRSCPPLACSVLASLEPLLNPVWVFLLVGERPGVLSLIGGAVVIVSITLWCVYNETHPRAL